ncbi:MAG: hypothetical protein AB7V46_05590 [Thermomicrobiales bacterium]
MDEAVADLEIVRDLARKAHADAIPELIDGGSVAEIMRSVEGAREAFSRVSAEIAAAMAQQPAAPPPVPAGGSAGRVMDVDRLPPSEKLRLGVRAARQ